MTEQVRFEVSEHGGIDPCSESPRFVAQHKAAYDFASGLAGERVLEVGCGHGYGASQLARVFKEVVAIDLFPKNVAAAQARYRQPNLRFLEMNATDLGFEDASFDLVVSFQVIEHIPSAQLERYLTEIRRVLKVGGAACLTTLNLGKVQKPGQPYRKSPHHDKEFYPEELRELLSGFFPRVEMYGLYPTPKHLFFERLKKSALLKMIPSRMNPVDTFYRSVTPGDFRWVRRKRLDRCEDSLGFCTKL